MNKHEELSARAYDKKAKDYDQSREGRFTEPFKALLLKAMEVPSQATVLDVACGNGRLLQLLNQRQSIRGYGIDISPKMIEEARLLCPGMEFTVGPCAPLPYKDESFDVISVCAAYHHFPKTEAFATEAWRTLKPDGRIYIADVYYPAWLSALLNPLLPLLRAGDVRLYSPQEIVKNLKQGGFSNLHYCIVRNIQVISGQK